MGKNAHVHLTRYVLGAFIAFAISAICCIAAPSGAYAAETHVSNGTDLVTAVASATAGDTIVVDGDVQTDVTISATVDLTIKGKAGTETVKRSANANTMVGVNGGAKVTIENLTFDGGAIYSTDPSDTNYDVDLGRSATNTGLSGTMFAADNSSYLTLNNVKGTNGTSSMWIGRDATIRLGNGTVLSNQNGHAQIWGAHLIMDKGSRITSCRDGAGGAIYMRGATTVDISGSIDHNVGVADNAGAIYIWGTTSAPSIVTLNDGGEISNNVCRNTGNGGAGGGVYVNGEGSFGNNGTGGQFIMNGGTMQGNRAEGEAKNADGDYHKDFGGGAVAISRGVFIMNDGLITGNSARCGGGVFANQYVDYQTLTQPNIPAGGRLVLLGGEISDNILLPDIIFDDNELLYRGTDVSACGWGTISSNNAEGTKIGEGWTGLPHMLALVKAEKLPSGTTLSMRESMITRIQAMENDVAALPDLDSKDNVKWSDLTLGTKFHAVLNNIDGMNTAQGNVAPSVNNGQATYTISYPKGTSSYVRQFKIVEKVDTGSTDPAAGTFKVLYGHNKKWYNAATDDFYWDEEGIHITEANINHDLMVYYTADESLYKIGCSTTYVKQNTPTKADFVVNASTVLGKGYDNVALKIETIAPSGAAASSTDLIMTPTYEGMKDDPVSYTVNWATGTTDSPLTWTNAGGSGFVLGSDAALSIPMEATLSEIGTYEVKISLVSRDPESGDKVFCTGSAYIYVGAWEQNEDPILNVARLYGDNRFSTAGKVATFNRPSSDTVFLASGEDRNWPDALTAAGGAGIEKAPIVLTPFGDTVGSDAMTAIKALSAKNIVICGGSAAVSSGAEKQLKAAGYNVTRLGGDNRMQTAEAIYNKYRGSWSGSNIVICTSKVFADALSVSPYAYYAHCPILLTDFSTTAMTNESMSILKNNSDKASGILICGGDAAVGNAVVTAIGKQTAFGPDTVERLGGFSRYETSSMIAEYEIKNAYFTANNVAFARGQHHADALVGGALQGMSHAPLMLVDPGETSYAEKVLTNNDGDIFEMHFFGGTSAVSEATSKTLIESVHYQSIKWLPDNSVKLNSVLAANPS